jgi:hypothetical protein
MTVPEVSVGEMSVAELTDLAQSRHRSRGTAVFELARRAGADDAAVIALGRLSRLPVLRDDRLFHLVAQAWAAIIGLLAAETDNARRAAYAAFADLEPADRADLLAYLKVDRIEDAHPQL